MMFLVLAISGNPFFNEHFQAILLGLSLIPIYYSINSYKRKITYATLGIFTFLLGYEVMHSIMFNLDYSRTYFQVFLKLWIGFSVLQLLKDRFVQVLVDTMVIICIISLVFTFLSYVPGINTFLWNLAPKLFPIAKEYVNSTPRTLVLYTFSFEFFEGKIPYARNSGIFVESGAFSVFLSITLFLNFLTKKIEAVGDLFDRKSLILIITLVSTTSTTGLLVLVVILLAFTFRLRSKWKYVFLLLFAGSVSLAFLNISYLGDKIESQLADSESNNRFGAALLDFQDISRRPVLGWSRRIEVLFDSTVNTLETHRPNGLTNFIRSYGLLYFVFYFILVYKSFNHIILHYRYHIRDRVFLIWVGILIMWLLSFSQLIYDKLFLKCFMFIHLIYWVYKSTTETKPDIPNYPAIKNPKFRIEKPHESQ